MDSFTVGTSLALQVAVAPSPQVIVWPETARVPQAPLFFPAFFTTSSSGSDQHTTAASSEKLATEM